MLPVTLGLGLINVNAVIDTFFASRLIDPTLAPTAIQKAFLRLHAPAGDVLGRGRDRALPVALAARVARRHGRLPPTPCRSGLRQIAFLLVPGERRQRGARRADRPDPLPARRVRSRRRRRSSPARSPRSALGLVFNGAMLMLNRAFFSLQSNWIPTIVALGNLALERDPRRRLLPLRHLGHPALDRRSCNIAGTVGAARPPAPAASAGIDGGEIVGVARCASSRGVGRRRRRRVRGLGAARRGARPVVRRRRSCRSGSRSGGVASRRTLIACRALRVREMQALLSLRSRVPARLDAPWTSRTSATSRSSRTSTTASRRSPTASSS